MTNTSHEPAEHRPQKPVRVILPRDRGIDPESVQAFYEAIMDAAAKQKAEWEKRHRGEESTSPTPRAEEEG